MPPPRLTDRVGAVLALFATLLVASACVEDGAGQGGETGLEFEEPRIVAADFDRFVIEAAAVIRNDSPEALRPELVEASLNAAGGPRLEAPLLPPEEIPAGAAQRIPLHFELPPASLAPPHDGEPRPCRLQFLARLPSGRGRGVTRLTERRTVSVPALLPPRAGVPRPIVRRVSPLEAEIVIAVRVDNPNAIPLVLDSARLDLVIAGQTVETFERRGLGLWIAPGDAVGFELRRSWRLTGADAQLYAPLARTEISGWSLAGRLGFVFDSSFSPLDLGVTLPLR